MDRQVKENLIQLTEDLLLKMGFEGKVEIDDSQPDLLAVKIQSEEAGFLIGQGGENLFALQHLARAISHKRSKDQPVNFFIDINNYRTHRIEALKEAALVLAGQVAQERQPKIMEPMSAYERRIIHVALKDFKGVKTESRGEGPERRVVINPIIDVG
jgi:spoIIIJ-associated protein